MAWSPSFGVEFYYAGESFMEESQNLVQNFKINHPPRFSLNMIWDFTMILIYLIRSLQLEICRIHSHCSMQGEFKWIISFWDKILSLWKHNQSWWSRTNNSDGITVNLIVVDLSYRPILFYLKQYYKICSQVCPLCTFCPTKKILSFT